MLLNAKTRQLSPVTKRLLEDHEYIRALSIRLKGSLQEICRRQSPEALEQTKITIHSLVQIMNSHAILEERVVFPALSVSHPILALEAEHDEIVLKRAVVAAGITNYSFPEDCTDRLYREYMEFIEILQRHLTKEEDVIFPLIDILSEEELKRLAERMEQLKV